MRRVDNATDILDSTAELLQDVDVEVLRGASVVDIIVAETSEHDVTVIGATRESLLDQLVFRAVPEEMGRRVGYRTFV